MWPAMKFMIRHTVSFFRVHRVLITIELGAVQRDNIVICPQLKLWPPLAPKTQIPEPPCERERAKNEGI